jgi:hypothetical protein
VAVSLLHVDLLDVMSRLKIGLLDVKKLNIFALWFSCR